MRLIKISKRDNFFKVSPESFDDLWHLSFLIDRGDFVSMLSERRYKPSREREDSERKKVYITLEAEEVSLDEEGKNLRILGIIVDAKPLEYVELKAHHSFQVFVGDEIKVNKLNLLDSDITRLRRAEEEAKKPLMFLVVLDDENAILAELTQRGLTNIQNIKGQKKGKYFKKEEEETYLQKVSEQILSKKLKTFVGGPGFEKEKLQEILNQKKFFVNMVDVQNTGISGLDEMISKIKEERFISIREVKAVEEFMKNLPRKMTVFGLDRVEKALEAGALNKILVLDDYLKHSREKLNKVFDLSKKLRTEVIVINHKQTHGEKLKSFGSIVGVLRFKFE